MKNTAFTEKHIALGAKMVPFAGYNMPVEYYGINEEHNNVRTKIGVFDVSHMGEIWVKGLMLFHLFSTQPQTMRLFLFRARFSIPASPTERAEL